MLRRLARAIFVENAALKAISLVLALALYVFVRGDRPSEIALEVPVVYRLPQDRVLMTEPVDRLRLTVRGPWARTSRFDERDLDLVEIDLSHAQDGEFRFPLDAVRLPPGFRLLSLAPATMRVRFEPRVTRSVKVEPRTLGQLDPGVALERLTVDPEQVTVTGAQSVVEGLQKIATAPVRLTGLADSVTQTVELSPLPPHAQVLDPGPVRVVVRLHTKPGSGKVGGPP